MRRAGLFCFLLQSMAGNANGVVELSFEEFSRGGARSCIERHGCQCVGVGEVRHVPGFACAEDEADGFVFFGLALVLIEPAEIKFHLAFVSGLKLAEFEIDGNQTAKAAVIKEEVEIVIFVVDGDSFLAGNECEVVAEFENEVLEFASDGRFDVFF